MLFNLNNNLLIIIAKINIINTFDLSIFLKMVLKAEM